MSTAPSPARGLLLLLKEQTSLLTGWHFATGRLVSSPDQMVVLANSGGLPAEPSVGQDYPKVQILCRGPKGSGGQEDAYLKLRDVRDALVGIPSRPATYPNLASVTQIGDIADVGFDDQDRPIYSLNLQLIVWYETSGYREAV